MGPPCQKVGSVKKSDPRMSALQDLHSMLSQSIAGKLKAKKSPAPSTSPAEADEPSETLTSPDSEEGELDEKRLELKKKAHFGPGHKK